MWSTQALAPERGPGEVRINDRIDDAYDTWKEVDAAARLLQRAVTDAWERYERGVSGPPSRDLLAESAWLRNAARERLEDAMLLLVEAGHIQPSENDVETMD
ncbi:hypothetical protein [Ramlibacter sp.]|jgi:hypothetical protein|uniref:hypothetical protein n=1 Tax=Ramlibacter sp. TaxID=1917967 RepID=UPI00262A16C8|nr:hypothetical protein [Ramlibacter sp.]MDB5956256.1 hypothetical protein [Ramlibacter sp.]